MYNIYIYMMSAVNKTIKSAQIIIIIAKLVFGPYQPFHTISCNFYRYSVHGQISTDRQLTDGLTGRQAGRQAGR